MQNVFSNEMVLHTWSQQNQTEGRNSSWSFSFNGPYLQSYRTTVAIHYGDFVLVTADNFSPTTGKQISHLSTAVSPARAIRIDNIFEYGKDYTRYNDNPKPGEIKKQLLIELDNLALEYTKKRTDNTRSWVLTRINTTLKNLRIVCDHFGLKQKYSETTTAETFLALAGDVVEKMKKAEQRKTAKKLADIKKKQKEEKTKFEAFLNGESSSFPWSYRNQLKGQYLTIHNDRVVTSEGAVCPIEHAKTAFKLYRRVLASGQPWKKNGEQCKLGYFQLDEIDINGNVKAGCHLFLADELKRFSDKWGF